ncbi:TetR/AcrR family transcriptional regulator [Trinickia dinghuensis]|uniref:TetR/AcrR family transcriptional regulator n=1 Tax=Trinickia dinghuensis TaxID=2291023 RepID=A0A3D8JRZ8_9BURK|nr:TetR/AcrR family transcriptional regulator [Trinickia dinghuensis]RDU95456.1 TetR/AcrR family transcriptional regulator [Trinickia dinghuensis]
MKEKYAEISPTRAPRAKAAASRTRPHTDAATAQELLLRAAGELFYQEGVRAVGVDAVVERAGVNKMSLYRQFSSKDELIEAYLEQTNESFFANFDKSIGMHPGEPVRQIAQYFEDLTQRASREGYRGCPFVNVAAEFPDPTHPAREIVARNKAELSERLTELTTAAGADDPAGLADALALLIEGIYAASQTFGPGCGPILAAPRVAAMLVAAACGKRADA